MKFLEDIQNWTATEILIGWFVGFILHQSFNAPYRIKNLLGMSQTRYSKFPDCYPCFTFWITLIVTLSPIAAIGAFLIAQILDRK